MAGLPSCKILCLIYNKMYSFHLTLFQSRHFDDAYFQRTPEGSPWKLQGFLDRTGFSGIAVNRGGSQVCWFPGRGPNTHNQGVLRVWTELGSSPCCVCPHLQSVLHICEDGGCLHYAILYKGLQHLQTFAWGGRVFLEPIPPPRPGYQETRVLFPEQLFP